MRLYLFGYFPDWDIGAPARPRAARRRLAKAIENVNTLQIPDCFYYSRTCSCHAMQWPNFQIGVQSSDSVNGVQIWCTALNSGIWR